MIRQTYKFIIPHDHILELCYAFIKGRVSRLLVVVQPRMFPKFKLTQCISNYAPGPGDVGKVNVKQWKVLVI